MKLSIVICSINKRLPVLAELISTFEKQLPVKTGELHEKNIIYELIKYAYNNIELIICIDNGIMSVGAKRNLLVGESKGEYIAHFDDDDLPSDCYIEEVMKGVNSGADCCSLVGEITFDGQNPKQFRHFLSCKEYAEIDNVYVRYPNHLNTIKASIVKKVGFQELNHGEDTEFATQLHWSGLITSEHPIEKTIYHYRYKRIK